MITVRAVLLAMRDRDAEAAADLMEKRVQDLDSESNCGRDVCVMFQALYQYLKSVEETNGHPLQSPEDRWELWSDAVATAHVLYFG